ncbi:hypothetical protein, conserved [Eimeria necatrix]|uniref:Uncharacterized protein n=1 Tax=Eimeria necatrix TaxID=51315 RepID=U6N729_9EIME|nr:hypothetical protein, conserved [Eimeria necatrix]CDJ70500.1 hypothetical protein, conserved [Eimeria necatrix]
MQWSFCTAHFHWRPLMASVRGSCGAFPRLASSQCGPLQAGSRATAAVVPVGLSAGPNGSEQLPLHRVSSRRICPPGYLTGLQGQRRFFGVSGSYGYGAFYRGEADLEAQSNVRLQRLDTEEIPKKGSMTLKMPETVAVLAAEGALRRPLGRPGVSMYHHHVPNRPEKCLVFFSATAREVGEPAAAAIVSMLQQRERGVATQLVLDGRGVKAYFDPEWPDLMIRLGVGVKPLALRRLMEQYATKARIFVDKRGLLLTVHGWDKRAVGTLTMELYRHIKANPYTGKGARIAFHPIKKKVSTKK